MYPYIYISDIIRYYQMIWSKPIHIHSLLSSLGLLRPWRHGIVADVVCYGAAASACEKGQRWSHALQLLAAPRLSWTKNHNGYNFEVVKHGKIITYNFIIFYIYTLCMYIYIYMIMENLWTYCILVGVTETVSTMKKTRPAANIGKMLKHNGDFAEAAWYISWNNGDTRGHNGIIMVYNGIYIYK